MNKGLVSIVMAVHNEKECYLRTAIDSILNQTYCNIEIILIDDASDVECQSVINNLCSGHSNFKIIHNETNLGLTKSLNRGLELVDGEYIARMDADDYSLPTRIEKQVNYLSKHTDIDFVGTGVVSFGVESIFMSPAFGYKNDEAQCNLFFSSTLCHPSVMMRRRFIETNHLKYDENVRTGQDYDFWERCSVCGKLAVMNDVLLYYRTHVSQITSTNRSNQNMTAEMVQKRRLERLGIIPTEREYICHQLLASGVNKEISPSEIKSWIDKILWNNKNYTIVCPKQLKRNLQDRYTLYKIRNHVCFKHYDAADWESFIRIVVKRIKMIIKLKKIRNQINKELRNEN